jgi:pyrimidine-specific ribonucleoside hydrolase
MIYYMGGAVDVAGNAPERGSSRKRRVAEWNMYLDPHAAGLVLSSGAPVTLVPLDATNHVPLTERFRDRLHAAQKTAWADFVWKVIDQRIKTRRVAGFCFWDPLTVAIALDEQQFTTVREMSLEVVEEEGPACGQTRKTKEGGNRVRVCQGANAERFEDFFLGTLNS